MARRKSPTASTETYTQALDHLHLQHAKYLLEFDFDTAMGHEIRKSEIARISLLNETRATVGQDDKLVSFFEELQVSDGKAATQHTLDRALDAVEAAETELDAPGVRPETNDVP